MFIQDIKGLHPATARLLATRMIRSIGQGILVVDFTLYLHAMHWKGSSIGIVLSSAGLFGALLSLIIGVSSDRLRRKPFLLVYQLILIISCIIAMITAQPWLIGVSAVVGGFGRGANGAAGPFSPAEQAWLAENIKPSKRGLIFQHQHSTRLFRNSNRRPSRNPAIGMVFVVQRCTGLPPVIRSCRHTGFHRPRIDNSYGRRIQRQ